MQTISHQFIELALEYNVIQFGDFELKSGRRSPYFFNAGLFHDGNALARLGELYAAMIVNNQLEFDMLYGPAYKGIPLVVSVGIALASHYGINKPITFNRKQLKTYGDKGQFVGAPLSGNILLIDDVITAGTAIREAQSLIEQHHAKISAVMVAFDRQERGQGQRSTIQELEHDWQINVHALANLTDIICHLEQNDQQQHLNKIMQYQSEYGVTAT